MNFSSHDGEAMDIDEEAIFQLMAEQGDEDAVFVSDFEDQVVEAVQDSPELAAIYVSYQEARARVRERPEPGASGLSKAAARRGSRRARALVVESTPSQWPAREGRWPTG